MTGKSSDRFPKLSRRQAEQVASHLSGLVAAGLPLEEGLRATAGELGEGPVGRALRVVARELGRGRPLADVLCDSPHAAVQYIGRLAAAAAGRGTLAELLAQLAGHRRVSRRLRQRVLSALVYPSLVLSLCLLLMVFMARLLGGIVGQVQEFESYFSSETALAPATQLVIWWGNVGVWIVLGTLVAAAVAVLLVRLLGGRAGWRDLLATVPLIGPPLHWAAVAEWSQLMAILLRHQVPLPEALRLAAGACSDAGVARQSRQLAAEVEQGRDLVELLAHNVRLPPLLGPLARSGMQSGSLAKAFEAAGQMYQTRTHLRTLALVAILPAMTFVVTGGFVGLLVTGIVSPFTVLARALSGSTPVAASAQQGQVLPFNLVSLALLGAGLLWTISLIYGRRGPPTDDPLKRGLTILAWIGIVVGMFGALLTAPLPAVPVLLVVGMAVLLMTVNRFQLSERRALAAALATAAEWQIPLPEALVAYAEDCPDEQGLRVARLARLLDGGMPLRQALRAARTRLPLEASAALAFGSAKGCLPAALRETLAQSDQLDSQLRSILARFLYLCMIILLTLTSMVVIVPQIVVPVFEDLGFASLPDDVVAPRGVAGIERLLQLLRVGWGHPFLCALLVLIFGLLLLLGLLYYTGYVPHRWPVFGRVSLRPQSAAALRLLAAAVEQGQPLGRAVGALAGCFNHAHLCARLRRASRSIDDGVHWCDSLQKARLLGAADAAVLKAAEQAGNLAWALRQTADRIVRRLVVRLTAISNIAFPAVVLLVGLCVLSVVLSVMLPLTQILLQNTLPP